MQKALLILNPKSGKMKLQGKLFEIVDILSQKYTVTVCPTKAQNHAKELAKQACSQGYDVVICAGGDGTLNETVCGLMESDPCLPLGYIPAGSTNDFAAGVGIPIQPLKAAQAIVSGSLHPQDIGLFNKERRFTYIASFGAFTETSYATNQNLKNLLGHLAYVLEGAKSLTKIKAIPMTVHHDQNTAQGEFIFGAVANAISIGGVLRLKDDYLNFHDGIFEILLIRKPKNILQLNNIITSLLKYEYDGELVQMVRGSRVECLFEGELPWSLDGEYAPSRSHVTIENLHHGVHLLY
ncbi:MAG: diacylglycerol kinase family lipid kinase [Clostridia bacterium]|nr:diacylglycerol kinase family lipid kinase [Clostridia bacterium]